MNRLLLLPLVVATAATTGEVAEGSIPGLVGEMVALLKAGGPLALAVLAGIWAVKKDREKEAVQAQAAVAAKSVYEQMVTLVAAQTMALVKMEATIGALKDVISAQDRRRERDRDRTG